MSENSWSEFEFEPEFEFEIDPAFLRGLEGRRLKAALMLGLVWSGTIALHQFTWGYWLTIALAALMGAHSLIAYAQQPLTMVKPIDLTTVDSAGLPYVSLMVAAKNEEAVVERLVEQLCHLDYPDDRYEVWFIDDNSDDRTPELLDQLAQRFENLRVVHRSPGSTGGKSGALNQVFPRTQGEYIVVFDADAKIAPDFLLRSLPAFDDSRVGAVQLRKAIIQAETAGHRERNNFWIRGQQAEMALDAFMRQQQIAHGGIGELRGNGQLVRRRALETCGGWNEETITDDLDLTLRLHLSQWDIHCLSTPAVYEEGVTKAIALWHQRCRWAEGGYQRYLDYWRLLIQNQVGSRKSLDLVVFIVMQYVMPMVMLPDLLMAIVMQQMPVFTPVSMLTFGLFMLSAARGLRRADQLAAVSDRQVLQPQRRATGGLKGWAQAIGQSLLGLIYMAHWLPVIIYTTARMAVQRKRLKWVKTVHTGVHG
jgi:1,2-diacylglycerol 3-beta-glucosyltransferase